jgi:RimJ/RimL family protein N-acetyltransferase
VRGEQWAARLELRPLSVRELPLLHEWLGTPHVQRWWGERGSYEATVEHYLPSIDGRDPTLLLAVVVDEHPVGLVQTYLVADYPDWAAAIGEGEGVAGIDLFVAEETLLGRGLGTAVIRKVVREIVFAGPGTTACVADPDVRNEASLRAFARAGFRREREFRDPEDGELHALVRLDR